MKKILCIAMSFALLLFSFGQYDSILYATDFAGNEDYYWQLCASGNILTDEEKSTCRDFRQYFSNKSDDLKNQVDDMEATIDSIKGDIAKTIERINQQKALIAELDAKIAQNEEAIIQINASVVKLEGDMIETQANIDKRKLQIEERMVSEQASLGTNVYVEFVMGAKDLVDLLRIVEGVQRITENDKQEMEAFQKDKEKLEEQKAEQERLRADVEKTKAENEADKANTEILKRQNEELMAEYQQKEADLIEQQRNANAQISAISSKIISINTGLSYNESTGFMRPVSSGYISAGTFSYPGGGFHAGLDFATSIGSPIQAPIGGIIVYANNPVGSNSGYLNNFSGHPAGGGNTIHMVGVVNGTTFGISFFHLAQENFIAAAGNSVNQGDVIGYTGNSGNSSGPHCHIEIINLGGMSIENAVARFKSSGADFAWGTRWNTTSTSCSSTGWATPCRERPEDYLL